MLFEKLIKNLFSIFAANLPSLRDFVRNPLEITEKTSIRRVQTPPLCGVSRVVMNCPKDFDDIDGHIT